MNVLKQIQCSWKIPFTRTERKFIQYTIQYERINHIANRIIHSPIYETHDDTFDVMIYNSINTVLQAIPGITDFRSEPKEFILYTGLEDERRALMSNIATGQDFRRLQIRGRNFVPITNIAARLWFTDWRNQEVQDYVISMLPIYLEIEHDGPIPNFIVCPFMTRQHAEEVLHRNEGIDLGRFNPQ